MNTAETNANVGPLAGLRVLELGQMVAGPFATRLMAEFGADVVKVEPPGVGDALRQWRVVEGGTSLWWYVQSRNKRCITLNLRHPRGQELARSLIKDVDILVENFRPGTLEKWGLDPEDLLRINPRLIVVRISGFGQTGPYRDQPGFGSVGESMGGIRYVTGYPDRPPVRSNLSLGDSVSGLYAAYAALMAVHDRDVRGSGQGQIIDVALYESILGVMEGLVPEYDRAGFIRERHGNRIPGIAPQGTYPCREGRYVVIGGNGDAIFKRLMQAAGRNDLAEHPDLQTNAGRSARQEWLDEVISGWTSRHTVEEVLDILQAASVPAGPIYTAKEIVNDPHFQARGMIQPVEVPGLGPVKMPGIMPLMSRTPGETRWAGPPLRAHNQEVYQGWLGLTDQEIAELGASGII